MLLGRVVVFGLDGERVESGFRRTRKRAFVSYDEGGKEWPMCMKRIYRTRGRGIEQDQSMSYSGLLAVRDNH